MKSPVRHEHEVITFVNGKWRENCYIVGSITGDALVIDPGSQPEEIVELLEGRAWRVHAILNTHAHYDHIGAVAALMTRYSAPFYLHAADERLLRSANLYRMLFESREAVRIPSVTHDISQLPPTFSSGPFEISWIATPGHTPGSVCLRIGNVLFSGDTLMHNAVGRTDLPGANREQLLASVRKLMELPPETIVCGGHGPRTTLEAELSAGARVWSLLQ
jgi:glyoxylase-like metal-dependent hydrolase (beta-lactamase superfamily II)